MKCKEFSIVLTTKNRLNNLKFTLNSLSKLIEKSNVELLIYDDASTDGTQEFLKQHYSADQLFFNIKSKGLIHNRNVLNNKAKGTYIISLDDDSNFLTDKTLDEIQTCFDKFPRCGVQSLRIFWSMSLPPVTISNQDYQLSSGFVGCGHVWRKEAWKEIGNYPDWFVFYGEEEFASFQLFKNNWKIIYNPYILVHHRVDVSSRKNERDYRLRLRRSLRSGWYIYVLFYPLVEIPKRLLYTLWMQIKKKTFKGDMKATVGIMQALGDLVLNLPRLIISANRLTKHEFIKHKKLPETHIYWKEF